MLALVYEGVRKLSLKQVEKPAAKDTTVVVKVAACAICGTDVKAYTTGIASIKPPVILGHEFVGVVSEVGAKVADFKPGDRVTMATTIPCGRCPMCVKKLFNLCMNKLPVGTHVNGAFAEYLEIPERGLQHGSLMKVPDGLSDEVGSLCEPLGCVINSQRVAGIGFPQTVVVIGAGPLGLLQAETAKARGALETIMVQRSRKRAQAAEAFDVDHVICSEADDPVEAVMDLTRGMGADAVINAAPSKEAARLAFEVAAKSGRISLFASVPKDDPWLPVDVNRLHYDQISVFGASDSTPTDHADAMRLLAAGKISSQALITHTIRLEDFFRGLELIKEREALKVVVKP